MYKTVAIYLIMDNEYGPQDHHEKADMRRMSRKKRGNDFFQQQVNCELWLIHTSTMKNSLDLHMSGLFSR